MMAALFFLLFLSFAAVAAGAKKIAIYLWVFTLLGMAGIFYHHITDALRISL